MKKIIMFLLVAGLALTIGVACGSTTSSSDSDGTTTSSDSDETTTSSDATISIKGAVNSTKSSLSAIKLVPRVVVENPCPWKIMKETL